MKKILFVVRSLRGRGAEKALVELVRLLDKRKYDITVLSMLNQGVYIPEIKKYAKYKTILPILSCFSISAQCHELLLKKLGAIPQDILYRLCIKERYDLEVAFMEGEPLPFILSSPNRESVKAAYIHSDHQYMRNKLSPMVRAENRRLLEKADVRICVSETARDALQGMYGLTAEVRHNLIDGRKIRNLARQPIEIKKQEGVPVIVAAGQLVRLKGFERLIRAVGQLTWHDHIPCELWILGKGEDYGRLEALIISEKLKGRVKLLGYRKNPYAYLKQADLYVCSSETEAYPNVVLEALVLGKPVISTRCGGPQIQLKEGKFGLLVENSYSGIYEGLKELLTKEENLIEWKKKAIQGAKYYSDIQYVKEYEEFYDKIMGRGAESEAYGNRLTTKKYWDGTYKKEIFRIRNKDNPIIKRIEPYLEKALPEIKSCFEIGCYPGGFLSYFGKAKGYQINGIDYSEGMDERFYRWLNRLRLTVGEVKKADFFEDSKKQTKEYDFVYSLGFIEHFKNYKEVIGLHDRYLKKGGLLFIETPNFKGKLQYVLHKILDRENLDKHYLPSMDPEDWKETIEHLGPNGYEILYCGCFGGFDFWTGSEKKGPVKRSLIHAVSKIVEIIKERRLEVRDSGLYSPFCGIIARKL